MWKGLAEEIHFFLYHYKLDPEKTMRLPIVLRKWMIDRFIEQKEKENEAIEASKKRSRSK